jgi:hypothetical protein
MTPDDISKATTPNALRDASPERLDDLSNNATSLLLSPIPDARQMQAALQAIHAEKVRRHSRKPKSIEWAILIATIIGVLVAIIGVLIAIIGVLVALVALYRATQ